MRTTPIDEADLRTLFGPLSFDMEAEVRRALRRVDDLVKDCAAAFTSLGPHKWRVSGLSMYAGSGSRMMINTYLENHASSLEEELTVEFELSTAGAGAPEPDGSWTLHVGVFIDGVFSQELAATLVEETYPSPRAAVGGLLAAMEALRAGVPDFPQSGEAWRTDNPDADEPPFTLRRRPPA
jgi:hypothetical protein